MLKNIILFVLIGVPVTSFSNTGLDISIAKSVVCVVNNGSSYLLKLIDLKTRNPKIRSTRTLPLVIDQMDRTSISFTKIFQGKRWQSMRLALTGYNPISEVYNYTAILINGDIKSPAICRIQE